MIKQKQLNRHRPELGIFGDCQRTVYACLLNLEPKEVPNFGIHFNDPKEWDIAVNAFLKSVNLSKISTIFECASLQDVLTAQKIVNPGHYYMLSGTSANGVCHVVICLDDEIYWDTAIDDSGIVGPCPDGYYWIEHLVPLLHLKENEDV